MMKTIVKDTLRLVVITLCAAICLSFVHEITAETIETAEAEERAASYRKVFPEASSFEPAENYPLPELPAGVSIGELLYAVNSSGERIGCVISATSANGYVGDITLSVGIDSSCTVTGMTVTAMSETSGLGSHCQDEDFQEQFKGIAGEVEYVKDGRSAPNEIDMISGATFTTRAVTEAVNGALSTAAALFDGGDAQ